MNSRQPITWRMNPSSEFRGMLSEVAALASTLSTTS